MAGDVLEVAAPERTLTDLGPPGPGPGPRGSVAAFFLWGSAAYLIATFGVLARALGRTDGRMVYVIDDAAIHLSVARNLADHGTWGVEFQVLRELEFLYGRRWPTRELAIAEADERKAQYLRESGTLIG